MVDIDFFAEQYPLVRRFVAQVSCVAEREELSGTLDPPDANIDFYVRLKSGLSYAFVAATPENARYEMVSQGKSAFAVAGMVIVSAIEIGAILEAVEQCLEMSQDEDYPLRRFGCAQRIY